MRKPMVLSALLLAVIFSFTYAEEKPDRIESLIKKLGAEDYEEREAALEALKSFGDEARSYLKGALESDDPEVRWRASRLLSMLDGKKVVRLKEEEELDEDLSLLRRHLRSLRNAPAPEDEPMRGFFFDFSDEAFQKRLDQLMKELSSRQPPMGFHLFDQSLFRDLEVLMKQLEQSDGGLQIEMNGRTASYRMERRDGDGEEILNLEVAQDGSVKAAITTTGKNGDPDERTYEADSLEAFRKSNPDVAGRFNLDGFTFGFKTLNLNIERLDADRRRPLVWSLPDPRQSRKTLGVFIDPEGPDKVLRTHMGLKENEGVVVEEVLSGSFAAKIGLKPMDIIVAINGKAVGSADDIRTFLEGIEGGDAVKVTLLRNGERLEVKGRFPHTDKRPV